MEAIQAEIISLVAVVIASLVGLVTQKAVQYLNSKGVVAKIQGNQELAKMIVKGAEQAYFHLDGAEKMALVKENLSKIASEKGLKITVEEMDFLIESSVKEMNDVIKKELNK